MIRKVSKTAKKEDKKPLKAKSLPKKDKSAPKPKVKDTDDEDLAGVAVIPVNKLQTYGIVINSAHSYVTVMERTYYKKDTKIKAVGKVFLRKAGTYSDWKVSTRPYQRDLASAIGWIIEMMTQDKLCKKEEIAEIKAVAKMLASVTKEVYAEFKANRKEK